LNNIEVKELNNDAKYFSYILSNKMRIEIIKEINKGTKRILHVTYLNSRQQINTKREVIKHVVFCCEQILSPNHYFDKLLDSDNEGINENKKKRNNMMIIQEEGFHLFFDVLLDSILKEENNYNLQDHCYFQYNLLKLKMLVYL